MAARDRSRERSAVRARGLATRCRDVGSARSEPRHRGVPAAVPGRAGRDGDLCRLHREGHGRASRW